MGMAIGRLGPAALVGAALWAAVGAGLQPALAGESPFGYVYTTDTHPKGVWEFEQWLTNRRQQSRGDYSAWQSRSEIEYGVTDALQAALYANFTQVNAFHNRPDGTTGPGAFVPDSADPDARYRNRFFESVSNEWIYRVLSPYKDPIGLAFYVEPSYGPKVRELEGKIIVQKNFLEDQLIWAANFTAAREKQSFHGDWEKEAETEFTTGLAYAFAPRWAAGAEYRRHTGYDGYSFSRGNREFAANFIGPSVHYAGRSWWLTATWLTQLRNATGYTDEARQDIVGGRMYGEEHERNELRIRVGFSF